MRFLPGVCTGAVTAFDNFVEQIRQPHVGHLRRKFARVLRTDSIVLRRRPDKRRWILHARFEIVQRGNAGQKRAFCRNGNASVFAHPRRTRRDLLVAHHVQQRHRDLHRIPELRMLVHLDAHQQTAIRTAYNAESSRTGDCARDQILTHGRKVVVDHLSLGLESCLVPCRTKLAAAANIRHDKHTALLNP